MSDYFDINQKWINNNLPVVNGVLHSDGIINQVFILSNGKKRSIENGDNVDLNNLLAKDEIDIVEIAVLKKLEDSNNDITVYCGMGFMGGDGFIVVENQSNSLIKWCAFFEESNPFENIEIIEDKIIAYNNLNEKWIFDINDPTKIFIDSVAIN